MAVKEQPKENNTSAFLTMMHKQDVLLTAMAEVKVRLASINNSLLWIFAAANFAVNLLVLWVLYQNLHP